MSPTTVSRIRRQRDENLAAFEPGDARLPVELPLKQWAVEEAERAGVKPNTIYTRISRGKYPLLARRMVNARTIYVRP